MQIVYTRTHTETHSFTHIQIESAILFVLLLFAWQQTHTHTHRHTYTNTYHVFLLLLLSEIALTMIAIRFALCGRISEKKNIYSIVRAKGRKAKVSQISLRVPIECCLLSSARYNFRLPADSVCVCVCAANQTCTYVCVRVCVSAYCVYTHIWHTEQHAKKRDVPRSVDCPCGLSMVIPEPSMFA